MNEDVNKFVDELVKQLELPGRNTSISDDLIADLKSKATVEDARAAATIAEIDVTIISRIISSRLSFKKTNNPDITIKTINKITNNFFTIKPKITIHKLY